MPQTQVSAPATYVRYDADIEEVDEHEAEYIDGIVEALRKNNEHVLGKHGHAHRDAHAKSLAVLKGEIEVYPNLPQEYRQGFFAEPRTYPVIARYSSTSGEIRSDLVPGVRGLSLKILDVPGPRHFPSEFRTQDFLFVNNPTFPFADAKEYLEGMGLAALLIRIPDWGLKHIAFTFRQTKRFSGPIWSRIADWKPTLDLFTVPNRDVLGETFHSAAAQLYGDYIAKISVWPLSDNVRERTGRLVCESAGVNAHRNAMLEFYRAESAEYEIRVQLCTDKERMPVENARVDWPEALSPFWPVAKVRFGRQDSYSPARMTFADDYMSFDSWNTLAAHRPLGSLMRLRQRSYEAGAKFRHRRNNAPRIEPTSLAQLPD